MKRKAEYLLDKMAYIDDAFISEAENYHKKSIIPALTKTMGIAAAVIICISSVIMTLPFLNSIFSKKGAGDSSSLNNDGQSITVASLLDSKRSDAVHIETENLSFEKNMLVWQYEGESGYYVIPIENGLDNLTKLIGSGKRLSPEESADMSIRIWLCNESGTVISPQLIGSMGNIGYKCLFDYRPEIEPNEIFLNELEATLSRF